MDTCVRVQFNYHVVMLLMPHLHRPTHAATIRLIAPNTSNPNSQTFSLRHQAILGRSVSNPAVARRKASVVSRASWLLRYTFGFACRPLRRARNDSIVSTDITPP